MPPDSLQGSHVTRWPGFYILQWKFHSTPACAATNLPRVDDVLASLQVSSHKCKVMYYTEVIGSEVLPCTWGLSLTLSSGSERIASIPTLRWDWNDASKEHFIWWSSG